MIDLDVEAIEETALRHPVGPGQHAHHGMLCVKLLTLGRHVDTTLRCRRRCRRQLFGRLGTALCQEVQNRHANCDSIVHLIENH